MWLAENEGAKFWLSVLTQLENRSLQGHPDCLRGRSEGLPGFDKQRLSADSHPAVRHPYAHWENLNTFFGYPPYIRKAIYTTNATESLNSVIRAVIKKRKVFPTDDSVRKVVYLAIKDASKKWSMPLQN
ncbi:hypothetical protein TA05_10205 [Citrobacter rodentium]|nr:hypothetical protein TA05_10205 [Citrobacter rodentium]